MKTSRTIFFMALVGLLMTACQSDEDQVPSVNSQEQTAVNFELDASAIKYDVINNSGLKYSPTYSKDDFRIYAFKRVVGGTDYVYEKTISLSKMTYSNNKLTGSDILNIGTYKFISAYGVNQSSVLTIPTWTSKVLTDGFSMQYNGSGALGEIFLQDTDVASLGSYELGLTSDANPTVTATLKRAVSRVDIMFFKGKKESGEYTELAYTAGNNVFGQKTLEALQLRYTDLNTKMDFFGNFLTATPIDANINLGDFTNKVTIGNATATIIGDDDYTRYDNVDAADLINGAAHVFGNYVIPNADETATAGLEIYIKPVNGEARTISIVDKLPMERNKVTLVKIYVLDNGGGPEEPNVFTTNVNFEVEIETVWDGSNEVTGEIN